MKYRYRLLMGTCLVLSLSAYGCGNANDSVIAESVMSTAENISLSSTESDINQDESISDNSINEADSEDNLEFIKNVEASDIYILDALGYRPEGRKRVFVYASELDSHYELVNVDNGRTVFANDFKAIGTSDNGNMTLYMGDFTDYISKGNFRFYHKQLGYSEIFTIGPDCYKTAFEDIYNKIEEEKLDNTGDALYVLSNLLMTKDIYPDVYCDDAYIEECVRKMMLLQDEISGVVKTSIDKNEDEEDNTAEEYTAEEVSTTMQYAGVLAQYSCIYDEENPELAAQANASAIKAFALAERNRSLVESDIYYYAACELYRLTGQYAYRSAIEWYDTQGNEKTDYSCYKYIFSADVAYLKTNYRTDYERCQQLIKNYLNTAEKISEKIDKSHFYVQNDINRMSASQMLDNMQKLALVSYVVSGHEYTGIVENYFHYLNGVNDDKMSYCDNMSAKDLSKLIFSLGQIYGL